MTNTRQKHTETPWTVESPEDGVVIFADNIVIGTTSYKEGNHLWASNGVVTREEAHKNAKHIIKCVNNFPALVNCLSLSIEALKQLGVNQNTDEFKTLEQCLSRLEKES